MKAMLYLVCHSTVLIVRVPNSAHSSSLISFSWDVMCTICISLDSVLAFTCIRNLVSCLLTQERIKAGMLVTTTVGFYLGTTETCGRHYRR